ncbi:T9SS type A sorting domain-containing protein [Bacteroidota bacterium]
MKKLSIIVLAFMLPCSLLAQSFKTVEEVQWKQLNFKKEANLVRENVPVTSTTAKAYRGASSSVVWEENFLNGVNTGGGINTDKGTWVRGTGNGNVWKFSKKPSNGCWSEGTETPTFSTAANGFLLFDADSVNCQNPNSNPPISSDLILEGSVVSPVINLSSAPNVALSFEYATRWFGLQEGQQVISVALSKDGGSTWSDELEMISPEVNVELQSKFNQNVSALIGGASSVKIRFTWSGTSDYFLAIDDVQLYVPASDDVWMNRAIVSHNGKAVQYARVPVDQIESTMFVGAEVYNFGLDAQSDVALAVEFKKDGSAVFTGAAIEPTIATADTAIIIDEATIPTLTEGLYIGDFVVSSKNDTAGGENFSNNTLERRFAVTNELYSVDGLNVHSNDELSLSALGTYSFTGSEDGLILFNYYDISSTTNAIGLEIYLTSDSEPGSYCIAKLYDTSLVFMNGTLEFFAQSDIYDITKKDVDNGIVRIMFDEAVQLKPNAYLAGVEMFSNSGQTHMGILDDLTITQPFYASTIFTSNDNRIYSNGNALAIRLIAGPTAGITNQSLQVADLSVYPNPSNGERVELVMLSTLTEKVNWELIDITGALQSAGSFTTRSGKNVQQLDVSNLSSGVYLIKVASNKYHGTQRIVIEN